MTENSCEFYVVTIGDGLYLDETSSMFSKMTTDNLMYAKKYDIENGLFWAKRAAKKHKGKVLRFRMMQIPSTEEEKNED